MWGPAARFHTRLEDGLIVPEGRLGWMLAIVGTALGAYFTRDPTTLSIAIGIGLQVVAIALGVASLRAFGAGERLVSHGPYRWVRHPFYLGILLLLIGAIVALRAWAALILLFVAYRLTVKRARIEEHNLRIEFGSAYDAYAARVPFLLPLAPPLPPGGMTDEQRAGCGLLGTLLADGPDDEYRAETPEATLPDAARPGDPP
jgi:protein-S-isoprenylcysteine O-methyltransferase Ste14